jgi:hypothetical protein
MSPLGAYILLLLVLFLGWCWWYYLVVPQEGLVFLGSSQPDTPACEKPSRRKLPALQGVGGGPHQFFLTEDVVAERLQVVATQGEVESAQVELWTRSPIGVVRRQTVSFTGLKEGVAKEVAIRLELMAGDLLRISAPEEAIIVALSQEAL